MKDGYVICCDGDGLGLVEGLGQTWDKLLLSIPTRIGLVCLRVAAFCNMHYSSNPTFFIRVLNLESELIL